MNPAHVLLLCLLLRSTFGRDDRCHFNLQQMSLHNEITLLYLFFANEHMNVEFDSSTAIIFPEDETVFGRYMFQ
jgi:hypothetical protein